MTPLGRVESVEGRASDFRKARRLGDAIPRLFKNHGDLYFLGSAERMAPVPAARLVHPASGRILEVSTNEHCIQIYTGMALDGTHVGKSGRPYSQYSGICLECEGYPDGDGHPELGSILVGPGMPQERTTRYAFLTD